MKCCKTIKDASDGLIHNTSPIQRRVDHHIFLNVSMHMEISHAVFMNVAFNAIEYVLLLL